MVSCMCLMCPTTEQRRIRLIELETNGQQQYPCLCLSTQEAQLQWRMSSTSMAQRSLYQVITGRCCRPWTPSHRLGTIEQFQRRRAITQQVLYSLWKARDVSRSIADYPPPCTERETSMCRRTRLASRMM